ncbi:MAG: DUF2344 domain-containing protein [candidate division Zixibacteria bacterium]|nr:DUF2344 domain-containing protein [candidate division Zixibacteria bacterium]
MRIPQSFFYKALKPGRYLGADLPDHCPPEPGQRRIIWFYPGRYEDAVSDPGYCRGFFTLRSAVEAYVARAIDFDQDAWQLLADRSLPPFTLDAHEPIGSADVVVFWIPDVFGAVSIPSILARLNLDRSKTKIGAVIDGCWVPPLLKGHVDWMCAAPYGWMPAALPTLVDGADVGASPGVYIEGQSNWSDISQWSPESVALLQPASSSTQQWLPIVETGHAHGHLELLSVNDEGHLAARSIDDCTVDALDTLRTTGCEGLRLLDSGIDSGHRIPAILTELTRVFNMARTQVDLPPFGLAEFDQRWRAYKPHLIKPILRLRVGSGDDPQAAIAAGRNALNDGWHGLTLVAAFESFAAFSDLVPQIATIVDGWSKVAVGFDDRRQIRVQLDPAPIERWAAFPAEPSEEDLRRLLYEFRHLAESVSSSVTVGHPRLEQVIARNWLAATTDDIWNRLAELDWSDSNDNPAMPFDWLSWIRNRSGMTGPPSESFVRGSLPTKSLSALPKLPKSAQKPQTMSTTTTESQSYGRRQRRTAVSRRLQAPARNRLRACWGKSAAWRFFSHLDMVRVVERSIRVARLPVSYSEGFHPRMKVSFGPPLSFGLTSRAELFDVLLDRNVEESDVDALRQAFPDGVDLIQGEGIPSQVPSLTESINEAEYGALIPLDAETAQSLIEAFIQQPSIRFTRPDRPDRKPFDPRVSLRATEMEVVPEGVKWRIRVSLGTQGQIRPAEWAQLIFGFNEDQLGELVIERTALRVRSSDKVRSPFDTVNV